MSSDDPPRDGFRKSIKQAGGRLKSAFRSSSPRVRSPLVANRPLPQSNIEPLTADITGSTQTENQAVVANRPASKDTSDHRGSVWAGLESALQLLQSVLDGLPPFKAAIENLRECLDVFEISTQNREGYDELIVNLTTIVSGLRMHLVEPRPIEMSNSVLRVIEQVDILKKNDDNLG
ncbi:hypothetical protein FRC09_005685 [Ceratobasidium sp. 395]|nr:hypothetical protein FRC09_005685 [Ceratobasidium sp. 395]